MCQIMVELQPWFDCGFKRKINHMGSAVKTIVYFITICKLCIVNIHDLYH